MTTVPNITYPQIYSRLLVQLPPWFGTQTYVAPPFPPGNYTPTTNFNNIIWAYLITAMQGYNNLQYDFQQMRIGAYEIANPTSGQPEATGDNLDLISQDFFGNMLPRRPGESDDNYRNRILVNIISPMPSFPGEYKNAQGQTIALGKGTRPAMLQSLINLVTPAFQQAGIPVVNPLILEGWDADFDGGYDDYQALAFGTPGGSSPNGVGWYTTGSAPYTCTIIVYLPHANGLATFPGYIQPGQSITWGAGFGSPAITPSTPAIDIPPEWYGSDTSLNFYITMQDIINVINATKVLGTTYTLIIQYVN